MVLQIFDAILCSWGSQYPHILLNLSILQKTDVAVATQYSKQSLALTVIGHQHPAAFLNMNQAKLSVFAFAIDELKLVIAVDQS